MPPECFGQDPDCSLADHPGHAVSWYSMSLPTFQASTLKPSPHSGKR